MSDIIFRSDYMIVREHVAPYVAVQVGSEPDETKPTIVDGRVLVWEIMKHLSHQKT